MDKALLSIDEVAKQLGVSRNTVKRLITTGKLNAIRVERQYRIRSSELEDYLKRNETSPKEG